MVKEYDVIAFGTGSALNIVSEVVARWPKTRIAVIEKDIVGGICLTKGCIPSKMILYPAELLAQIERAELFGIEARVENVDPNLILKHTRDMVYRESRAIEESLNKHPRIDLYKGVGEFIGEYTVKVGDEVIRGEKILLCTGSRPFIPPIPGLEEVGYLTSDNFFELKALPKRVAILGGGYVGLELGFFMAMMGSKVTILEMLPRIAAQEEPEISELLRRELSRYMDIRVNHKVVEVFKRGEDKIVVAENTATRENVEIAADEILVATGRRSNSDITKPEKTGVKTDKKGWIITNEYLETTKPNIWAFGDANGKYMFKHKANYEARIVFHNAFLGARIKADYSAVPHAIFTYPEVASVGMREEEAAEKYDILVGYSRYEDTAKGSIMLLKDYFVKVIIEKETYRILGAHIIGPHASILIQEVVNLMYTQERSAKPIYDGMHIHPALSEVVENAFLHLHEPEVWKHHH